MWHVDYLKLSHEDKNEVTNLIKELEMIYGIIRTMRGNDNEYLGIHLYFSNKVKVKVSTINYL